MTESGLTLADVQDLAANPSGEARAAAAAKIASSYGRSLMSQSELKMAQEIFRLMMKDAEVRVREALSINLKSTPLLPRDIAMSLARDVDSVAVPMIEMSDVLTTEDLIEIINSQNPTKLAAVADRATIHADVAEALVEQGGDAAVTKLVGNPGAHLTEPCIHRVVDRFGTV